MKKTFLLFTISYISFLFSMNDDDSPLLTAVKNNNVEMVRKLIYAGANIRLENKKGESAITFAIQENNIPMVEALLDGNYQHATPESLMINARKDFFNYAQKDTLSAIKYIEFLLKIGILEVNSKDISGTDDEATALLIATNNNSIYMAKALLNLGANIKLKNQKGEFPLEMAIKANNEAMVKTLLENSMFSVGIDQVDQNGNTPLMLAIKTENINIIKAILNEVPNLDKKNNFGETAVTLAQKISDISLKNEILKLLNKGNTQRQYNLYAAIVIENPDLKNIEKLIFDTSLNKQSWRNPLIATIITTTIDTQKDKTKKNDIINLLIKKGANVNQEIHAGLTPLIIAILATKDQNQDYEILFEIIKLLLQKGANPNVILPNNKTALLLAIEENLNENFIKLLLEHGANPNIGKLDGQTGLVSVLNNSIKKRRLLIQYKADVNIPVSLPGRRKNMTPLMIAASAYNENVDTIKDLLEAGADPLLKNSLEETALDFARDEEVIKLLKKAITERTATPPTTNQQLLLFLQNLTQKLNVLQKYIIENS